MENEIIKFTATADQLLKIAANAVIASRPGGMGFLHFQDKFYVWQEMEQYMRGDGTPDTPVVSLDYVDGRMVKLTIFNAERPGEYYIRDNFRPDYQSFCGTYPRVRDLIGSVGLCESQRF